MIGKTISHYPDINHRDPKQRHKILEKLVEGGMGIIYKAYNTNLNRNVALKFLPSHLFASEQDKQRFINEAKAASALDHPNICTIYEIGEMEDGKQYIAMSYYEEETLLQKSSKSIPLQKTSEVFRRSMPLWETRMKRSGGSKRRMNTVLTGFLF